MHFICLANVTRIMTTQLGTLSLACIVPVVIFFSFRISSLHFRESFIYIVQSACNLVTPCGPLFQSIACIIRQYRGIVACPHGMLTYVLENVCLHPWVVHTDSLAKRRLYGANRELGQGPQTLGQSPQKIEYARWRDVQIYSARWC